MKYGEKITINFLVVCRNIDKNDSVIMFIQLYINLKNSMNENTYNLNISIKKVWQGYKQI